MKNYFKKFSIMFVMTLVIIGLGIIQNGTVAKAATVGQPLPQKEDGWERYDDNDGKIQYTGSWKVENVSVFIGNSQHDSVNINDKVTIKFRGTKFRLISSLWSSSSPNIGVYIDGKFDKNISQVGGNLRQSLSYEITKLKNDMHTIEFVNNTNGYLTVDAIDIGTDVEPIQQSITLDKSTMNLTQGDSGQLTATTTPAGAQVTWKSSESSVATVDSDGKVTAEKEGTCTITVTTADGLTATCVVTVTPKGTDPNPQPTDTEYITNIAHAKGTNTNNPGGEVTIIFHGTADTILSIVKTADVKDVWVGDNFTYTLVITNTGIKTAKAVVVNDPAPNHIDFNVSGVTTTQGSVDSSSTSKNIIVNVGDILPGGTVTIKIPSTVIA